jgi:hypothetical protein
LISELKYEGFSDIYVICDPVTQTGCTESLILASLPEHKRKCIENFIIFSSININDFKKIVYQVHKTAYPEDSVPFYNFDHPNFQELKDKLANLFK